MEPPDKPPRTNIELENELAKLSEYNAQLQEALSGQMHIEQAKGVVAERHGLDVDEAFTAIRKYARDTNQRLVDVATRLVGRRSRADAKAVAEAATTTSTAVTTQAVPSSRGRLAPGQQQALDAVAGTTEHRTADEIHAFLQVTSPNLRRAAVYRSLDALTSMGLIEHIHLGHGPAVYHPVSHHHMHLVCEQCDAVTDVDARILDSLQNRLATDYSFNMDEGHFAIVGTCAACGPLRD